MNDLSSISVLNEEKYSLIDINEIQSVSGPFIAAIEPSPFPAATENWSVYPFKPECQSQFEKLVSQAISQIAEDNPYLTVEPGEIAAISSLNHKPGSYGLDIRPKVYDGQSKTWTLLDSGSCVSCIPKKPNDKIDPNFRLRAVNGGSIATFGSQLISVRLGRKTYDIEAVKVDIPERILGWDFFKKHSLGFEWGPFGDLYITDNKSNTKSLVKCFKLPSNSVQSVDYYEEPLIQSQSTSQTYFETNCMKSIDSEAHVSDISSLTIHPDQESPYCDDLPLDTDIDIGEQENLKALSAIHPTYKSLIEKYPSVLKTKFKKEPANIYHRIETEGPSFKSKVRPLLANSEKYDEGRRIWSEMEKAGVIERVKQESLLQYTSPLHMVKKPSGRGWRVCADFRKLNQITKTDNYPLPLLRSFQASIRGSRVFSKIDIKSAFHHLPIHPDDINKTCVLSPWGGAYVYKRLAFGLSNGPASWQKYVDSILKDIPGLFCYLDDILLCSADVNQHLSTLETVLKRLSDNGLTLALDKCEFGRSTVDYLGYKVTATGICPLKKKVEAIDRIPTPTTQKSLLHFLGALNYFRTSLSGLVKNGKYYNAANLLQPLYSVATVPLKANKFEEVWNNAPCLIQAFEDAKNLLKKAAELAHPNPQLPLALMCDASDHSIGSVLMQQNFNGRWSPLGYMSKHLPIDKTRWSTCRKELLAAQAGVRYFINEIYGRHCTIYSDHAPLVLAFKNPQGFQLHDPVAQRALIEIGQFTKDIRHIAGQKNIGSDFLSRIPPEAKGTEFVERQLSPIASLEGQKLVAMSPRVIFEAQQSCQETELIKLGKHPTSVIFEQIPIENVELLCETSQSQPRPFLPKELRSFVMKQMHYAHKGIKETIRLISSHYYWSEMRAEITRFVQTCHGCQSVKPSKITPPHYGSFEVPDKRFTHCHVDIVGPLPKSEGYRYILSIIDRTTRQLSALPLVEPSAKACSQAFLLHYVALYGLPSACTSDQGSNFVSALFQEMQKALGIDIHHTPVYWPQGNGLIERNHQTLKNSIKAQLVEMGEQFQGNWYHVLPWALLGIRTAYNKDLGTSSNELTLGTHVQVPGSILKPVDYDSAEPNIKEILENLQIKDNKFAIPTSKPIQKQVDPPTNVTHVYVKQHETRGLDSRYRGPFKIISKPTRSTLEIKTGLTAKGEIRSELRAWADCKPAYVNEDTVEASRPKRGRPPKKTSETKTNESEQSPNLDTSSQPFHGFATQPGVATVDFSKPPPPFPCAGNSNFKTTHADSTKTWSASVADLEVINSSISGVPQSSWK